MKRYITLALCVAGFSALFAQNDPLEKDKIMLENERIEDVIISDMPDVKIPFQEIKAGELSEIRYDAREQYVRTDFTPPQPEVKKATPLRSPIMPPNFIKAGLGRFMTPLAQLYLYNGQNSDYEYGLNFEHFSAHDDKVPLREFNRNKLDANAAYVLDSDNKIIGRLHVLNNKYYRYGDTLSAKIGDVNLADDEFVTDSLTMRYTRVDVGANLLRIYKPGLNFHYDLGAGFQFYSDRNSNREIHFGIMPTGSYAINSEFELSLDSKIQLATAQIGGVNQGRYFVEATPMLVYRVPRATFQGGARINFYNNNIDAEGVNSLAPVAEVRYQIVEEKISAFGGLSGGMTYNRYDEHIQINPYLANGVTIRPTIERIQAYAGISGNAGPRLDFNTKLSWRRLSNALLYYLPDYRSAQFQLGYDSLLTNIAIVAEVNYDVLEGLRAGGRIAYNNYITSGAGLDASDFANGKFRRYFHATPVRATAYASFSKNKLNAKGEFNFYSPTPVGEDSENNIIRRTFADISFSADYRIMNALSVWAEVNNLLSTTWQRWLNYNERPLDFRAGLTLSF